MPIITVETNLRYDQLSKGFGPNLSKFTSETLIKPEERITISLVTDRRMWRNGSDSPMMQIYVSAIGAVSTAEQNAIHARKFTDFIKENTDLPEESHGKSGKTVLWQYESCEKMQRKLLNK